MAVKQYKCVYKIQDTKTGLFSTGGSEPRWTKNGKEWTSEGALKSHLTHWLDSNGRSSCYTNPYGRCVVSKLSIPIRWKIVECYYKLTSQHTYPAYELADRPPKR